MYSTSVRTLRVVQIINKIIVVISQEFYLEFKVSREVDKYWNFFIGEVYLRGGSEEIF